MKIAIDASSAAVKGGSGIPVYIRSFIANMARVAPSDDFVICYRLSRIKKRRYFIPLPGENFSEKIIQDPFNFFFSRSLDVFHGIDARLPHYRSPALVATIMDLFSLISEDYATKAFRTKKIRRYNDCAKRAHLIIAVSRCTRRDIMKHLDVEPERIIVVHNGLSPIYRPQPEEEIARVRARYDLPERYIFYVGNISVRKNVKGLIRSFVKLTSRKGGRNTALILAGVDRYGFEEAHRVIHEAPGGFVRFLGYVPAEDIPALYAGARLFAFPSLYEGFGMPVLEAMASGVPVVCSDRASVPEVAGDAALLVDPEDYSAFAAQMERVLLDEELRRVLIQKGFERAGAFSWKRCAEETFKAYKQAVEFRG